MNNKLMHLESTIKRTLSDIMLNDVKSDIGFLTITDVRLTNDLSYLTVYFTLLDKKELPAVIDKLDKIKGFIRTTLVSRVQMRKAPELKFVFDETYEKGLHIDSLFAKIKNN